MENECLRILRQMVVGPDTEDEWVPHPMLEQKVLEVEELVRKVKPDGSLHSSQIIALIVWERRFSGQELIVRRDR